MLSSLAVLAALHCAARWALTPLASRTCPWCRRLVRTDKLKCPGPQNPAAVAAPQTRLTSSAASLHRSLHVDLCDLHKPPSLHLFPCSPAVNVPQLLSSEPAKCLCAPCEPTCPGWAASRDSISKSVLPTTALCSRTSGVELAGVSLPVVAPRRSSLTTLPGLVLHACMDRSLHRCLLSA